MCHKLLHYVTLLFMKACSHYESKSQNREVFFYLFGPNLPNIGWWKIAQVNSYAYQLGISVHNLECFNHITTYPKSRICKNPFTGQEITPLDICHKKISIRSTVREEILFLNLRQFLARGHIFERFGHFIPGST